MASKQSTATETVATETVATETVAVDPSVVKAANVVVGAVGTWSELFENQAGRYFTTIMSGADKALVAVGPSIISGRDGWALLNPTRKQSAFTSDDWVAQVAAQRGATGWAPNASERKRLNILFTLAIHGHSAEAQAHYVSVAAADLEGTYGVSDLDGYVSWLPKRSEYQTTDDKGKVIDLDVRSQAAIDADAADLAARKSEQADKASQILVGYAWETLAPLTTWTDPAARDAHLDKLRHDFNHYVDSQMASHGDADYVKSIKRGTAAAIKAKRQATATTPRAAK